MTTRHPNAPAPRPRSQRELTTCLAAILGLAGLFGCGGGGSAADGSIDGDAGGRADGGSSDGAPRVALLLDPGSAVVARGDALDFRAVAIDAAGERSAPAEGGSWRSADEGVIEVASTGDAAARATAVAVGSTTVAFVTAEGERAEADVQVVRSAEDIEQDVRDGLEVDLYPAPSTDTLLYLDCANTVRFRATNMGDAYTVTLENVTGGVAEETGEARTFTLSPSTDAMSFDAVVTDGERTERFEGVSYDSRPPPGPRIALLDGSREVEGSITASDLLGLQLATYADPSFLTTHPDDAAYRVARLTVTLDPLSGTPSSQTYATERPDLSFFRSRVSAGDLLHFEIDEVQRRNYREEAVAEPSYRPRSFTVGIR